MLTLLTSMCTMIWLYCITGGTHVNYIAEQIVNHIVTYCSKKHKQANVKPQHVKQNIFIFVNALIENPTFDSQTKINLTSKKSNFGSLCELDDKFYKKLTRDDNPLIQLILSQANTKNSNLLNKQNSKKVKGTLRGIPKLEDANDAGGTHSKDCTLILTEGDSAKALAVAGISVVGRDRYGVFPLKGKLMNVRDASAESVLKNIEISNLIKILGLKHKTVYTRDNLSQLRYGSIVIMTDQDYDGSHIKGLIINLFAVFWPSLLQLNHPGYLREFITPIVKCISKTNEYAFYTMPEYEAWVQSQSIQQIKQYRIKYYKGLGTSTSAEAKQYFSDMQRHLIKFLYTDSTDTEAIDLAFSGKRADARKDWLRDVDDKLYLDQDVNEIRYYDFVHKELILFSLASNMRAIPSLVDGLKPGQRKIIYICLKHNLNKEIKVAQLSGLVGKESAYHHGEQSLNQTIVGLAQNYVGSNNINLLYPSGQFGTRLAGGRDSASARYIYTYLSPITRTIYHKHDDQLLDYLTEENQSIEPTWFIPVVPMILINGSSGIGTGWSSNIPNYNIHDIIQCINEYIDHNSIVTRPTPYYKGFAGEIVAKSNNEYTVFGRIESMDNNKYHISELPVDVWVSDYKENVLEKLIDTNMVVDFREFHTEQKVSFVVTLNDEQNMNAIKDIYKYFKLVSNVRTSNMVLFDQYGHIKKYDTVQDILLEFCQLREQYYIKRKSYILNNLQQEVTKLQNQCRFIDEVIHDKFNVRNVKKKILFEQLIRSNYLPIKKHINKLAVVAESENTNDSDTDTDVSNSTLVNKNNIELSDFDYLLKMEIYNLTYEKFDSLNKQRAAKQLEYKQLFDTAERDIWRHDLLVINEHIQQHVQHELNEQNGVKINKFTPISKKHVSKTKTKITSIHGTYIPVPAVKFHTTPNKIKRDTSVTESLMKTEIMSEPSLSQQSTQPQRTLSAMLKQSDTNTNTARSVAVKTESTSTSIPVARVVKSERMILDSDASESSDIDISDSDDSIDVPVVKREVGNRRAAAASKSRYIESDSELDSSVYDVDASDEDEIVPVKQVQQKSTKPIVKKNKLASDSDDDDIYTNKLPSNSLYTTSPIISKSLARTLDDSSDDENSANKLFDRAVSDKSSSNSGPTKKPIIDSVDISDDDDMNILDHSPVLQPVPVKKQAAAKKKIDSDNVSKPAAKKAKTTKPAAKSAVASKASSTINSFSDKKTITNDSDVDIDSDHSEQKQPPKSKKASAAPRIVPSKAKSSKKRISSSEEDESEFNDDESDYDN